MLGGRHIDPHVHCRDWDWSYKATIKSVMDIARSQGVSAIFDMPNTSPAITTAELVKRRLDTAREEGCLEGYYFYVGLTGDPEQAREAARLVEANDKVVGLKLVAGKSVGALRTEGEEKQKMVYEALAGAGYTGVVAVHAEKEAYFHMDLWNPELPYTWNLVRPPESEIESVKDQIKFAKEAGFKGTLHICHVSTPETVRIVNEAKSSIKVVCGVTPHHVTYSTSDMRGPESVAYKVNPPLRDPKMVRKLRELLYQGKIDWIETDHAPHSREEKSYVPNGAFMSGIQSLNSYARFLQDLQAGGMSGEQIERLTYTNIKKVFTKVIE
jgi:dihydroorotase